MKNLDWKEFLRREGGSSLTILCGVILVMRPDTASALLSAVAGWALIGVRLMLSPLSISRMVLSIGGLALIAIGACTLAAHYKSTRYIPEPGGIIDADE